MASVVGDLWAGGKGYELCVECQEVILCGAPVVFLGAQSASLLSLLTGLVEIGGRGAGSWGTCILHLDGSNDATCLTEMPSPLQGL